MTCKTFEIRDSATFIPALAVQLMPTCERDRYLLARAGYGPEPTRQAQYVLLLRLTDVTGAYDPYDQSSRTMTVAHRYIIEHWDKLETGAIIDVEYILGITLVPKASEQTGG